MAATTFLIGLGGNRRHGRHGSPDATLAFALDRIAERIGTVVAVAPTVGSSPVGPGGRRYANAAALIRTALGPAALLAALKAIEAEFGRRRGRRWGARVLDLDILAWQSGGYRRRDLAIPHPRLLERDFALRPASTIAPDWRLPRRSGRLRHRLARLRRPRPVDRPQPRH